MASVRNVARDIFSGVMDGRLWHVAHHSLLCWENCFDGPLYQSRTVQGTLSHIHLSSLILSGLTMVERVELACMS